jgi:hypothetical protein
MPRAPETYRPVRPARVDGVDGALPLTSSLSLRHSAARSSGGLEKRRASRRGSGLSSTLDIPPSPSFMGERPASLDSALGG